MMDTDINLTMLAEGLNELSEAQIQNIFGKETAYVSPGSAEHTVYQALKNLGKALTAEQLLKLKEKVDLTEPRDIQNFLENPDGYQKITMTYKGNNLSTIAKGIGVRMEEGAPQLFAQGEMNHTDRLVMSHNPEKNITIFSK